ncbi:recombinase family protein [Aestuariibaculum sp. YM273]|uniref:recombinase family protein n=1 Tax=Aestuariibaculum sp. YM273 TaxID=3070659 RepID=UPI0027DCE80E|nr:recombinase family protein [Aestuariibaculum sp. YM273]WMI65392.1 recombinase family protein [Aestuariibaculum sp. YM273]
MLGIYTRLSREDDESNSISNQKREALHYVNENNIQHYNIYDEGQGFSGTLRIQERPELNRMIKDMESGKLTSVWMRKQDRLARLGITVMMFADAVVKNNITLIFGDKGKVDLTDPIEMFHLTIMAGVDALKPAQQSKATKRALKDNAKEGKVWGVIPYGYRTDDNMMPFIHKEEAKIINRIFNEYLSGKGVRTIATGLNNDNIPTKYGRDNDKSIKLRNKYTKKVIERPRKNIKWSEKTISDILKNTWYVGERIYSGEKLPTPKIIDDILFEKIQRAINSRKGVRTSTPKYNYLLKGLIRCNECGRNYYGRFRPSKNDNFYMCSSKRSAATNCGNKAINIPMLDSFIIKHLFKSKDLLKMMESISNNNSVLNELNAEIKQLEDEIIKTKSRVNKYAKLLGDELQDDEIIIQQYTNAKTKLNSNEQLLKKLKIEQADLTNSEALKNYNKELLTINDKSDFNTIKMAVNNIIEDIKIESFDTKQPSYMITIAYKGFNDYTIWNTELPYEHWFCALDTHNTFNESCGIPAIYSLNEVRLFKNDIVEFN